MSAITRREFVAGLGSTLLAGAPGSGIAATSARVVVVGAGLAGMAAAHELGSAGFDVRVLEQSSRAGGRIKTVHGHFADDAWVDLGGQSSGAGYANFFYYCNKFGLQLEPQSRPAGRPDYLLHLQGNLYSAAALRERPSDWPLQLTDAEKPLAPSRLLSHYLRPIAQRIGDTASVLNSEFLHYDELSLLQLLRQQGASDAAIRLIGHTANYNSLETVSALSALRDSVRLLYATGTPTLQLENGNSGLTDAFAKQLGDVISFRSRLTALEQSGSTLKLQIETNNGVDVWDADRVVLAIPFTALRKVRIDAELPAQRQTIIDELPYTQVAQTYLQTSRRFWEQGGPVAGTYSDGPLERIFNASGRMSGERGLLVNWINGAGVEAVSNMDADQQAEFVVGQMEKIWPGSRRLIETRLGNNWGNSYVKGAYAHYAPGQMAKYAAAIPAPVGRLHFAGEHTELVAPGMEGALTSGRRVADEIIAAQSDKTLLS